MRAAIRPLLLALVAGALMFPANLSAQSAPKTISTQDLAQTKNGTNDWITHGGALNNQRYLTNLMWWGSVGPGFAIFLAVFAFNFLGDALRDWLDPQFRRRA